MSKSIAKTVGLVMVITMLARLMALVSSQMYVTTYGVTTQMDIYAYATRFQLYTINMIGTTLITVMIPMFAGLVGTGEKKKAYSFAHNVITISFVIAGALAVLGIILAPGIIKLTRFAHTPEAGFAVEALRIMFPVLMFYTLTYTLQGILQSQGRFLMPAFVSVSSSLVIILYVLLLGNVFGVRGLLFATLIGLSTQAFIQIPSVYKTGYRYRPSFDLRNPELREAMGLVPPILISSSAYQVNMLYNISMSARFENSVTIINVAQDLVIVAILSLAISMTSVMFPRLTTLAAAGNFPEFKQSVRKILKTMIFLLVPMTIGLASVSRETISFIYGYGKFTADNIIFAAKILALYSIGGVGLGIKECVDKAFYSLKDSRKPAVVGVIMMVVNITVSLVLMNFIGVYAIPVAYSTASLTGGLCGIFILRKKIGQFGLSDLFKSTLKIIAASLIMSGAVLPLAMALRSLNLDFGIPNPTINLAARNAVNLFVPVLTGGIVFFMSAWFLKIQEAWEVLDRFRTKLFRGKLKGSG